MAEQTNDLIAKVRGLLACKCVDTPNQECGIHGDDWACTTWALADALESATRVPEQGEASAAIERVRAVAVDWERDEDAKGLHFDLLAALDGAPEPEWEYAWAGTDELGDDWIGDAVFDSVAEARTFFNHSTWVRTQSGELVRRRKAGPWEPIKGESE